MFNEHIKKICIGTAQFGMNYGIASGQKQVSFDNVELILSQACKFGIKYLDTAASYGDSENIIGKSIYSEKFYITTKIIPIKKNIIKKENIDFVQSFFQRSLNNLKTVKINCLLVHHAQDLLSDGGDLLWDWLENLKFNGIVSQIGVSAYDVETIFKIHKKYKIDVIQIPFNILDQRLERSGLIDYCIDNSISIHARSLFLQGVLLLSENLIPKDLLSLKPYIKNLNELASDMRISVINLLIAFVFKNKRIDRFIIGIHELKQLNQILQSIEKLNFIDFSSIDWYKFACSETKLIDPRLWS